MSHVLEGRVRKLEERAPRRRHGGQMVLFEDELSGKPKPWFDDKGKAHAPIVIIEDVRPAGPVPALEEPEWEPYDYNCYAAVGDDDLYECDDDDLGGPRA